MINDESQVYTKQDIAKMLKCSVSTIERMRKKNTIPVPFIVSAQVRWNKADIDKWVSDGCPKNVE